MRRLAAVTALGAILLTGAAGCSAAEDAASGAADAAKDRARDEASQAVASAVKSQICAVVGDGRVTEREITTLSRVLDQAAAAGVPPELLDPAQDIVSDGEASAAKVAELQRNCG